MAALFEIDARLEGFEAVERALGSLDPLNGAQLLEGVARLIQEQTRHRIRSEKSAPDGAAWKPNRAGTPILYRSGALARSIDYAASDDHAIVGSGLIYAGVHQNGAVIVPKKARRLVFRLGNKTVFARKVTVPPRPFLGVSAENGRHIIDATVRFLRMLLGGADG
jgi:phage virion morphogenesis protein